jgi:hypothetical protein
LAGVVTQHAAQSHPARHVTGCTAELFPRLNQSVAKALVVSLGVKMAQELGYGDRQRSNPEEDHALQALLFDRSHEALEIRIQVRRTRG